MKSAGAVLVVIRLVVLALLGAGLTACRGPTPESGGTTTTAILSDAMHNHGTRGFVWLPPMVERAPKLGALAPEATPTVRIDEIDPHSRQPIKTIATFTETSGPGNERVRIHRQDGPPEDGDPDPQGYFVLRWRTDDFQLSRSSLYRIHVSAPGAELGFADVKLVSKTWQRWFERDDYVPVRAGSVFRIKFHIEKKALRCMHVTCSAKDACHVPGSCQPNTGLCTDPIKANGSLCDDGSACTAGDACQGGVCHGVPSVTCRASDQCHAVGICNPADGTCSNPLKVGGSICNDGNACTQTDTCRDGACVGSNPVVCLASQQCHGAGSCDPSTGACSDPVLDDGAPCDDGNQCTLSDSCRAGTCTGDNPKQCPSPDKCSDSGSCNPRDGQCSWLPIDCSDGLDCTRDGCDPGYGCVSVHQYGGACTEPPPSVAVAIKDYALLGEPIHAGDRVTARVVLDAESERDDFDAELILFSLDEDRGDLPGEHVGELHVAKVEAGTHEYLAEVLIPPTLVPGEYEFAAHEYPDGEFVDSTRAEPYVIASDTALASLALSEPASSQQVVFLGDEDVPGADDTTPSTNPASYSIDLVALNHDAVNVPLTAYLNVAERTFPLRIWDTQTGKYVDRIVVPSLTANSPQSVLLDLVPAVQDLAALRSLAPTQTPVDAQVMVRVNEGSAIAEAPCSTAPPELAGCPHQVELPASLFLPAPATDDPDSAKPIPEPTNAGSASPAAVVAGGASPTGAAPLVARSLVAAPAVAAPVAPGATAAAAAPRTRKFTLVRFEKNYSKFIGNKWAGAGFEAGLSAKLATDGVRGNARVALPMSVLGVRRTLAEATVEAVASTEDVTDPTTQYSDLTVKLMGDTVYELRVPELNAPPATEGGGPGGTAGFELPSFYKGYSYSQTVMVGPIPVTFELGASGAFAVKGKMHWAVTDERKGAEIDYSLIPYAYIKAYGAASVGVSRSGWGLAAGIEVDLFLAETSLTTKVQAKAGPIRKTEDGALVIPGTLSAQSNYDLNFMRGQLLAFFRFPVMKFCPLGKRGPLRKIKVFCGVKQDQHEKVLAGWPGYHFGPYALVNKTWPLFELPIGCLQLEDPPANLGEACNSCDGVVMCDGSCSTQAPPDVGQPCGACGRVQCDGTCSGECVEEVLAAAEGSATLGGGSSKKSKDMDIFLAPPAGMRVGQPLGHYDLGQGVSRVGAVRISADRDWNRVSEFWVDIGPTLVHVHGRIDRPCCFKAGADLYARVEILRNSPEDRCGDSLCETDSENRQSCPSDCVQVCGDGTCEGGEAAPAPTSRCVADCGYPQKVNGQCPWPWGDCDANAADCEVDISNDMQNCMGCGNTCSYACTTDGCDVGYYAN